jgi:cell division protein FtsB
MTLAETKASIVSQLNQQAVATLVDQLANLSIQHETLKAEIETLKAKHAPKAD